MRLMGMMAIVPNVKPTKTPAEEAFRVWDCALKGTIKLLKSGKPKSHIISEVEKLLLEQTGKHLKDWDNRGLPDCFDHLVERVLSVAHSKVSH